MPSFNQAAFLGPALHSILSQRDVEFELIVMDGGSTDGSVELIRSVAPRLAHWSSAPDGGQASAIREGFSRASGDILCWLNSDDLLLPGALRRVAEYFKERPLSECVVGGCIFIDESDRVLRGRWGLPQCFPGLRSSVRQGLEWGFGPNQPATYFRRASYEAVGGIRSDFKFCMDHDLLLRLASRRPLDRLANWLACFRVHGDAKSTLMQDTRQREVERLYGEHRDGESTHTAARIRREAYRWRGHAQMLPRRIAASKWVGRRVQETSAWAGE